MRLQTGLMAVILFGGSLAWCDDGHHHAVTEEEVGSVHFPTSCSGALEKKFNRAVALLHSFQYEQARQAFSELFGQDPKCAMAQWGIAMSHYHGLWGNSEMPAGRDALHRAEAIASDNPKTSPRELAYIGALAEIYREDGKDNDAHAQAFEKKMAAVQAAYPSDSEAAIFHALALAVSAPKTDKTFTNQRECGEILKPIFAKQPHHPGIAHYIIHCYDNPVLASEGLEAARIYAKLAPASAHANHMPSHIFTRLGLWDESISPNLKSALLAANNESTSTSGEARDQRLHAMDYLEYAYLQSGRVKRARSLLSEMNALQPVAGLTPIGDYALAAIPARHAIELGDWKHASELQVNGEGVAWAQAITWAAIGIGSARSGSIDRATQAVNKLAGFRDSLAKQRNMYWSNQIEVQRREVMAWITEVSDRGAGSTAMMRSAAELEESMDKDAVTPGPVTPAREMLAEILMLEKHPRESLAEYEAVLKVAPNRFNALYGAANAADASRQPSVANRYFEKLTEIAIGDERPELVAARKKMATIPQNVSPTRPWGVDWTDDSHLP